MICGKCKCRTCANSTNNIIKQQEINNKIIITCFNCEECHYYSRDIDKQNNQKITCLTYKETDINKEVKDKKAITQRRKFKVLKGAGNETN